MLASIHPLGERARGQRFTVTVTAYLIGSVTGATGFGALFGAMGNVVFDDATGSGRAVAFAACALLAAVVEAVGRRPPSWHRQVNEDWLTEYRGWVYGAGFGIQLGVGVITIVTTAAVYLTWLGAFLYGDVIAGAAIGAAFGLTRALPVLAGAVVRTPAELRDRVLTVHRWAGRFRAVTVLVEAAAVATIATMLALRAGT